MEEFNTSKAGLNLHAIANSGQCFRLNEHRGFSGCVCYDVMAGDKLLQVKDSDDKYTFSCEESELPFWIDYFDLNTDYRPFYEAIERSDDRFLKAALHYSKGMRILNQDYWEALVSFIISQNNNIPRIKKIIERFCQKFGRRIPYQGNIFYTFPTKEEMSNVTLEDLSDVGLGYRDEYVHGVCTCSYDKIAPDRETLLKIRGIGPKVASCVLLYGHHDLHEFPLDVWMKRIVDDVYHGQFDDTPYRGFEGYVQLLLFYYYRNLKG